MAADKSDYVTTSELHCIAAHNNREIERAFKQVTAELHELYVRCNLLVACTLLLSIALVLEVCCG